MATVTLANASNEEIIKLIELVRQRPEVCRKNGIHDITKSLWDEIEKEKNGQDPLPNTVEFAYTYSSGIGYSG